MSKFLTATALVALSSGAAFAQESINMGLSFGYTGPLETLAPAMTKGAEMAAAEVSGALLDGVSINVLQSDSTCTDAAAAVTAAERLVAEGVKGIVGGMCSGETIATLERVAMPNGIVMVSPSATAPALSTLEDGGLFFRTSPSDARQGEIMADITLRRGIDTVAVTYTNNDYGKGLADSFEDAFKAKGGTVTVNTAHEDGKADYSAEVAALDAAGGDALVVAGYIDQGGSGIVRGSLDAGGFDTFIFPDGMVSQSVVDRFGEELVNSFGQNPAAEGEGRDKYIAMAQEAGFDGSSTFSAESYDAMAMMLLAMQAAGTTDPKIYKDKMFDVSNAPGEPILPGELVKGIELLKEGKDIDYIGAAAIELVEPGETAGTYREVDFPDGKMNIVGYH